MPIASKSTPSTSGKPVASKTPSFIPAGKSPSLPSRNKKLSSKSYDLTPFNAPKKKSSASFGIIWIPSRKNKKKDVVYNAHNYEQYKERAPTMYNFMAGDSSNNYEQFKKKEEDTDVLRGDKFKIPTMTVASASTAVAVADAATDTELLEPDEKPLFTHDKEESKEAAGDVSNKKDNDYLESNDESSKLSKKSSTQSQLDDKLGDKVDSVYLRPPPAHKARSQESRVEEDSCAMSCLYCVLTSCDCVLM